MTAALLSAANHLDELPAEPGISPRAARTVLRVYCKIAQHDGSFRYGLRGSKVAALAEYSLATVRRVQRYLVAHGFLEKVKVGGGRASTRWRVVREKLGLRHASRPAMTPQPSPHDTAQEHTPKRFSRMFPGWARRDPPTRPSEPDTERRLPPAPDICEHGSRAGNMRSGLPWCPDCRTQARRQPTQRPSDLLRS